MLYQSSTTWVCSVAVATVWSSPESARDIDAPSLECPVRINKWTEALNYNDLLDLCEASRVQTQLLFGEPVLVEEIVGEWAKIICTWQCSVNDVRGYPGWVPLVQIKEMARISDYGYAKVQNTHVQLWTVDKKPMVVVPYNTILPVISNNAAYTLVHTPLGEALIWSEYIEISPGIESFITRSGVDLISSASTFLELPYLWGGMSPYGYDCSGFTYNMLKANGYFIPRDAYDQSVNGSEVNLQDKTSWRTGDLLFFANEGTDKVRHVGIYYGNGQMIHAPSTGKAIEIIDLDGTKFAKELCAVRRYSEVEENEL